MSGLSSISATSPRPAAYSLLPAPAFAGQERLYGVRASVWVSRDAVPQRITLAAIWHLTVEDVVGTEQAFAGRLQIRALEVEPGLDPAHVIMELSPAHVLTFRRQHLVSVEAASPFAIDLVSRFGDALIGAPGSRHDSIRFALFA